MEPTTQPVPQPELATMVTPAAVVPPTPVPAPQPCKQYTLSSNDLESILVGACIAMAGAVLTYLPQVFANVNFGVWTPLATAILAIVVNVGRKVLDGQTS